MVCQRPPARRPCHTLRRWTSPEAHPGRCRTRGGSVLELAPVARPTHGSARSRESRSRSLQVAKMAVFGFRKRRFSRALPLKPAGSFLDAIRQPVANRADFIGVYNFDRAFEHEYPWNAAALV